MDIYSTRSQLAAIDLMPREYSVLYDFFSHDAGTVEDDKAIYDYRKGSRKMAPTVRPGTGGVLMDRDGYETREIGFCCIAPEREIEDQNLKGRMFGERVLGAMTPQERERKILARDLMEMRQAIQRRREWMVRQVLLTGKLLPESLLYADAGIVLIGNICDLIIIVLSERTIFHAASQVIDLLQKLLHIRKADLHFRTPACFIRKNRTPARNPVFHYSLI